ncbi:MAG TPA: hypothetical protein VIC60_09040 [Thermomicrobiales bacterium]|jgi:hypothetical protein
MAGAVGFALHADRLAQAATNRRLAEAMQGRRLSGGMTHQGYRAGIAAALVALAIRIAPRGVRMREYGPAVAH